MAGLILAAVAAFFTGTSVVSAALIPITMGGDQAAGGLLGGGAPAANPLGGGAPAAGGNPSGGGAPAANPLGGGAPPAPMPVALPITPPAAPGSAPAAPGADPAAAPDLSTAGTMLPEPASSLVGKFAAVEAKKAMPPPDATPGPQSSTVVSHAGPDSSSDSSPVNTVVSRNEPEPAASTAP